MKKLLTGIAALLALMTLQGCASRLITDDNNSPIVRQRTAAYIGSETQYVSSARG